MSRLSQRMDEDALIRLSAILEERAEPLGGMNLEILDGFLAALVVGPELVQPSEYLPKIWGGEPEWASMAEANEAIGLITALWNDIVRRARAPLPDPNTDPEAAAGMLEDTAPLLALPLDFDLTDQENLDAHADLPLGAGWAYGFLVGVDLRPGAWDDWIEEDEEVNDDLAHIVRMSLVDLGEDGDLDEDEDEDEDDDEFAGFVADDLDDEDADAEALAEDIPSLEERLELVADLPFIVAELYWKRIERDRPKPVRRPDLPGRNDPCSCGSGLKFKKCCGAPGKLN